LKRADQVSEHAASEAFSLQISKYLQGPCGPVTSLEAMEQLQDHDEAYEEAQELLSTWMESKLQLELKNDEEKEFDTVFLEEPSAAPPKYEQFDDLCSYLECELESSSVQEYLQQLLQSETLNCGIVEDLRLDDIKEEEKLIDPRIIMELRHKQVKENRMRRQKALLLQRQEKSLKKSLLAEAKLQAQEENRRKALKAKREEEEIHREMVKLRKKMVEKRHTTQGAWRMEKRQEKSQKLSAQEVSITASPPLTLKKEEQGEEKQRKAQELLHRIHINKQRCMQRHFSAWLKVILEHRIKMGKAKAFADWKCKLRALQAWRNYSWTQKVEQEIKELEVHLQDQNRKTQLAVEHNRRRLLHRCFLAWQHWSQAEKEEQELQSKREETMRKVDQLLEAVSPGKGGPDRPPEVNMPETAEVHYQDLQQNKVTSPHVVFSTREQSCWDDAHTSHCYRNPKFAWKITLKRVALGAQDQAVLRNQIATLPQQFQAPGPKAACTYRSGFEHHHASQQHLIEEQRQHLQKQQGLILELHENQRLSRTKAAAATAVTQALNNSASQTTDENQARCKNTTHLKYMPLINPSASHGPENTGAVMQGRKPSSQLASVDPILKAMEERAAQRAERRRKLEEAKQRKEEEKLAQMKAEEEARQRKEAEEKKAQQEKRQEERRQQKLREMEKQRRLEREQQLQKKARDHYEKVLLRKLGMLPWKKLREQAKENLEMAQRHHFLGLQRKYLMAWLQDTQESFMKKMSWAEDFYSHTLLRRAFRSWLKYKDHLSTLEEKVSTLHAGCLIRRYFWAWFHLVVEEKTTLQEKLKIATEHSNKRLMLNALKAWRQYPLLMKKEKEREERKNQLRRRVAEILPNFQT
ncbi:CC191 protein, partial [Eubucco bourcierii]|nr:CC191 protein [Eubucco bourcierii]